MPGAARARTPPTAPAAEHAARAGAGRAGGRPGAARTACRGEPRPAAARLAELLAGAAALVHPSRHEGFGLTLLEAMEAGVPVLAVANAGVREIVGDAALLTSADGLARMRSPAIASDADSARAADAGRHRARRGLHLGGVRTAPRGGLYTGAGDSRTSLMNVAILGTRGIPASYSGFETAVEQITGRLTARGHQVTVYCRPHVVDPGITQWKGARARPPAHGAQQVPRHLRPHAALQHPRGAPREARRGAVLHRGQQPAVPGHPGGRHPDRDQRRRVSTPTGASGTGWRSPTCAPPSACPRGWPPARSPTPTRSPPSTSAATAARSAWCPTAPSCPASTAATCWSASASSRAATCCSWAAWSPRTTPTCWWRRGRGSPAA